MKNVKSYIILAGCMAVLAWEALVALVSDRVSPEIEAERKARAEAGWDDWGPF